MYPLSFPLNSAVLPTADSSGLDFKSSVMVSECWDISVTGMYFRKVSTDTSHSHHKPMIQTFHSMSAVQKLISSLNDCNLFLYLSAPT